jgi:hypothetical protein
MSLQYRTKKGRYTQMKEENNGEIKKLRFSPGFGKDCEEQNACRS